MFAAKFPISQNPHGILYVYYTIIFLFLHFFCGKMRGQSVSVRSKVNRFKISSVQGASLFIYIGSHLALEKRLKKILSRTCMFQKCVVLLHPQSKGDTVVS